VVQRVRSAEVTVGGEVVGRIGAGLLVLVGVAAGDTPRDATVLARKLVGLRVFPDGDSTMGRSVVDVGGAVLVVSQFTLVADLRRGRRPSFTAAAPPEVAAPLVEAVATAVVADGVPVQQGRFGAKMEVASVNEGPFTLVLDVVDGKVR